MVFNPMSFLSQEQQELLEKVQKFTKDVKAVIRKEGDNGLAFTLITDNAEAKQYLPQIRESIINSLAQTLYTFFGITGEIK